MDHDLETQVDAIGLSDAVRKPVVMGEFGAFRVAYANPRIAAYSLAHRQVESCAFGFDGSICLGHGVRVSSGSAAD